MRFSQLVQMPFQAWERIESTYKFLEDKVRLVSSLNWRSVGHGTVIGGVALYLFHQKKVPAYLPVLCSVVAISILKQAWEHAGQKGSFSKKEQDLIAKEKKLNADIERLSNFVDEIDRSYKQFESSMKICLKQADHAEKVMDQQDEALEILNAVEDSLDKRLGVFRKRIELLSELSEQARSDQTVAHRLQLVNEANQRFLALSKNCIKREKELARLNRLNDSLESTQKKLSSAIEQLSEKINRLKDQKTALKEKGNKE